MTPHQKRNLKYREKHKQKIAEKQKVYLAQKKETSWRPVPIPVAGWGYKI